MGKLVKRLMLALLTIFIPFVEITKSKDYTLPEAYTNLPVIKLANIEQNPKLMREKVYNIIILIGRTE